MNTADKIVYSKTTIMIPAGRMVVVTKLTPHSVEEAEKKATLATGFNKWRQVTKEAIKFDADDAALDDAMAHFDRAQATINEALRTANTPIPAVLDPVVVDALKEVVDISNAGVPTDIRQAKLAELVARMDEAQMPQYMSGLDMINKAARGALAKVQEDRKRAREESAVDDESFTSPKKVTPLRRPASMTGGAFAPPAPVRPAGVMSVSRWPQGLAPAPVAEQAADPAAPAAPAADDMSDV
jgi:hypothetical protein